MNVSPRMRVIENSAVRLEPQIAAHAEEMFNVLSDPSIYEHENEPPASAEWLRTRFSKLESRVSPDGTERWLNWVIRLPTSVLVGYVQATVFASHRAAIAYELNSRYWGKGLAWAAVNLMIGELVSSYGVNTLSAVLKATNERSHRLLERLGFKLASDAQYREYSIGPGELLMVKTGCLHENGAG